MKGFLADHSTFSHTKTPKTRLNPTILRKKQGCINLKNRVTIVHVTQEGGFGS